LRQVVGNLVGNALRYTPEGSPIEVAVGVRTSDGGQKYSVIEVRDHGPGISEEDASKVFERFYRADTSRTRETGGSGLGLAIVAAIVGSHGGSVRVERTDGGGATLVVSLPMRQDADGRDADGRDADGLHPDGHHVEGLDAEGQDPKGQGAPGDMPGRAGPDRGDGGNQSDGRVIHI
jgi:two-component system OmpR family sensor kinase